MKVGIDVRTAVGKKTGIGYYTQSLVLALSSIDKENEYLLYTNEELDWKLGSNFHQIVRNEKGLINKVLWIFRLALECFILNKVDVFFSPNSLTLVTLSFLKKNCVLTVHDLVPVVMKETSSSNVRFFFHQLPIACKIARAIIVPSEATKKDLLSNFKIDENKVHLIQEASHNWCFQKTTKEEIDRVKTKFALPENYFLFVSTLEPRKNVPHLIRAFSKFSKTDNQNFKLVIGGKKGWMYDEIFEVVKDEKIENKIIFTDYISDDDILPLYKGATAFTFVPFMEGFGLTPLEAMATGIPVMTSNCSSLPEVTSDAAILVDPKNIDEIAEGMRKLATDVDLRKSLAEKGLKQVTKFSWIKSAELTLSVLEKVYNEKNIIK
jgi:glycosyltransferase involved in cell wall biosynthesis